MTENEDAAAASPRTRPGQGQRGPGSQAASGRRGNRRATLPGTSGQSEDIESQQYDPLKHSSPTVEDEAGQTPQSRDARGEWIKSERPPHWG